MKVLHFTLGVALATCLIPAVNGQSNRLNRNANDSTSSGRYEQDQQRNYNHGRTNQESSGDRNSTADSDDSWSEWFSDWWSDDSSSSSENANRSGGVNGGVDSFVRRQDDDDDGRLSRQELPPKMRSGFDRIDRDSDGYLSRSELRQHAARAASNQSPVVVTYVWVLGANQGSVKLADLQQAYSVLQEIDQDEDGEISREELRERHQKIASRWLDKCFQQHDENDDDQITRREAEGTHLSKRFDKLDRNSDDKLTRSELRQSFQSASGRSQSQGEAREEGLGRDQSQTSATPDGGNQDRR